MPAHNFVTSSEMVGHRLITTRSLRNRQRGGSEKALLVFVRILRTITIGDYMKNVLSSALAVAIASLTFRRICATCYEIDRNDSREVEECSGAEAGREGR